MRARWQAVKAMIVVLATMIVDLLRGRDKTGKVSPTRLAALGLTLVAIALALWQPTYYELIGDVLATILDALGM